MNATDKLTGFTPTEGAGIDSVPAGASATAEILALALTFKAALAAVPVSTDRVIAHPSCGAMTPGPLEHGSEAATPHGPHVPSGTDDGQQIPVPAAPHGRGESTTEYEAREARQPNPPDEEGPAEPLGVAVLQSMFFQAAVAPSTDVNAPAATRAPVESLETLVAETVSRVLVSDPLHDGRREVRVEVARDVLPDTEIRLWRDAGRLHVEITTSPAAADAGLREALPTLGDAIQHRRPETELPAVSLRIATHGGSGHPGDGRSRQQYQHSGDNDDAR